MAWYGGQYTLTASAASLTTILDALDAAFPPGGIHIKELSLQAGNANAQAYYVGKSNVTNAPANAMAKVPAGATYAQLRLGGEDNNPISTNDIFLVGTAADIALIAVVT